MTAPTIIPWSDRVSSVWISAPDTHVHKWAAKHGARYNPDHMSYSERKGKMLPRGALEFDDPHDAIVFALLYGL